MPFSGILGPGQTQLIIIQRYDDPANRLGLSDSLFLISQRVGKYSTAIIAAKYYQFPGV